MIQRIASGSLIPFIKTANDFGIDSEIALNEIGLTTDSIYQKQVRIPSAQNFHVLNRLIQLSNNPWLGLHTAKNTDMGSYDINGYISVNCSCPLEAIELTSQFYGIISDQQVLFFNESAKDITITWNIDAKNPDITQNLADHLLSSYAQFAQRLMYLNGELSFATFKHAAPKDPETKLLYEEIFNCPVLFDQKSYSIGINREAARDQPIPQADAMLRDILINHAETRLEQIKITPAFTYQVKGMIKTMLEDRVPSRECVAERLNMGGRTLQRHLLADGSSFKDAFNEVRQELSVHYLKNNKLTLDDIAEKLGFSETRSFHRSFKQWTGETVGSYRAQMKDKYST